MSNVSNRFAYEFILKINQAIETIISKLDNDPDHSLSYQKTDLKYSLSRCLYITFVNDHRLYKLFQQSKTGNLPKVILFNNSIQKEIANIICNNKLPAIVIVLPHRAVSLVSSVAKVPFKCIFNLISKIRSLTEKQLSRATIMFHLLDDRFIEYLLPIIKETKDPLAIVSSSRSVCKSNHRYQKHTHCPSMFYLPFSSLHPKYYHLNSYGLIDKFNYWKRIIEEIKPKTVVLIEGNSPDHEIINQISHSLSISTVCIQQGWSPFVHTGFKKLSFTKFLTWGQGFTKLLKPFSPKQKFIPIGHHQLVISHPSNLELSNRHSISFFFQPPTLLNTSQNILKLAELASWTASTFPNLSVIIRHHPVHSLNESVHQKLDEYDNVRFMSPSDYSLLEVLNKSFLSVTIYSTTILESIALGVFPLIFNPTSMSSYSPPVEKENAGKEVRTLSEAKTFLNKFLTEKKYSSKTRKGMARFCKKYFTQTKESISVKIVSHLTN